MQHRRSHDDVECLLAKFQFANIGLTRRDVRGFSSLSRADALGRSIEHGPAEIDQRNLARRNPLEQFQRVIAGTATDVENGASPRTEGGRRPADELQHQGSVENGRLTRIEVRKCSTSASKRWRISSTVLLAA